MREAVEFHHRPILVPHVTQVARRVTTKLTNFVVHVMQRGNNKGAALTQYALRGQGFDARFERFANLID